jgi:hypothetical protein
VPTILRFRNFRIVIYINDHPPAHVHARGPDMEAVFYLNCPDGPVSLRQRYNMNDSEENALVDFLNDNLELLCRAGETLNDNSRRA